MMAHARRELIAKDREHVVVTRRAEDWRRKELWRWYLRDLHL
jgi:hypothetical protein